MTRIDTVNLGDDLMAWVGRDALVTFVLDAVSGKDRPAPPEMRLPPTGPGS
jgi:hypothetical protein